MRLTGKAGWKPAWILRAEHGCLRKSAAAKEKHDHKKTPENLSGVFF